MALGACHECAGGATVFFMQICDYEFAVYGFFAEHSYVRVRVVREPTQWLTKEAQEVVKDLRWQLARFPWAE